MTISDPWWPDTGGTVQERAEVALAIRLRTAAPLLIDGGIDERHPDPAADAATVLDLIITKVGQRPTPDVVWLLLTSLSAAYPLPADVKRMQRQLELLAHRSAMLFALEQSSQIMAESGDPEAVIDLTVDQVVVDVDHSARFDLHTGIQRVVRSVLPHWDRDHHIIPAAWNQTAGALRRLDARESERVLRWPVERRSDPVGARDDDELAAPAPPRILVPWRSLVAMLEVPAGRVSDRLAALAEYSGNRLVGVAYDAIPIVSADMVPVEESSKFVRYLTCAKHAARMAGISTSATAEMAGFVRALRTQGLEGPSVVEVPLGSPARSAVPADVEISARRPPTVLVVGSHEPRKNHLAVLFSAESLWREGIDFDLVFVGGSGWGEEFPDRVRELREAGRSISVHRAIAENSLEELYRRSRFTVFPSLHEGYGLPVAESLARGTPVITSDFGSMAEIGATGGTVAIDPRDDTALIAAMRRLLTDPDDLARLQAEISNRPERSWLDYANELWSAIIEPERASMRVRA